MTAIMVRMVADENFNGDITRGLSLRRPDLQLLRIQDVGLRTAEDPDLLAWAAQNDRIVLTHDRASMPRFAYERIVAGQRMPGVFVLDDRLPVGMAIQELLLIDECSEHAEWDGLVVFLPL